MTGRVAPAPTMIDVGGRRLRIGPWRGRPETACLAPYPGTSPLPEELVQRGVDAARQSGYSSVVTAALAPAETAGFRAVGFDDREELHLLGHDLVDIPPLTAETRRARRKDRARILEIDAMAFDAFWAMDDAALDEALAATPTSRHRAMELDGHVVGYAVHGRAGAIGYVQRVAVDPAAQGRRLGLSLVADGLHWMRRRGCRRALVNTQDGNRRALSLYLAMGFAPESHRLAVLQLDLTRP